MKIPVPAFLKKIASQSNCPIFIVGGYIRNAILGIHKSDIDICGPLLPHELGISAEIISVNKRLGTAIITDGSESYEYTPFRKESYGEGGQHSPQSASFGATLIEDARRRDFTAGSVYYDIKGDEFIDPLGGLKDIAEKKLRSYDPDFTFGDDGLRLMRLVRIAAETGFDIDESTFESALRHNDRLKDISPERKREELDKILVADTKYGIDDAHYRGLTLMKRLGLWQFVIPELALMDGIKQNPRYHKYDCLEHTFMAVRFSPPSVRLAALMHDIAKPLCSERYGNTYLHPQIGAEMAQRILGQGGLKYPNAVVRRVCSLVKLHMYDINGNTRMSKLKLFVAKNFDLIPDLVALIEADGRATGMERETGRDRFTDVYNELIATHAPIKISDLNINGDDLYEVGYRGKEIGEKLTELWRECVLDPSLNDANLLKEKIAKKKYKV